MTNIVSLNRNMDAPIQQSAPTLPTTTPSSPLLFHAYERPLWYEGKSGDKFADTNHKALVRFDEAAQKPVCLNVVRNTYKVVQNGELFDAVEKGLIDGLGTHAITNARIVDKIARNGMLCYRQYIFDDISVPSPERDKIAFRVIIQNGFGGSAIKLHAGAIDFFCMNGMILGDYVSEYAKHTSGVKLTRFTDVVHMASDVFWKNRDTWNELRQTHIRSDDTVHAWMIEHFGERLGIKLFRQYLIEKKARGGSHLWAVYAALIYYSTYDTGEFTLRQTKNDHAAETMLKRELKVRQLFQGEAFIELRAAA